MGGVGEAPMMYSASPLSHQAHFYDTAETNRRSVGSLADGGTVVFRIMLSPSLGRYGDARASLVFCLLGFALPGLPMCVV